MYLYSHKKIYPPLRKIPGGYAVCHLKYVPFSYVAELHIIHLNMANLHTSYPDELACILCFFVYLPEPEAEVAVESSCMLAVGLSACCWTMTCNWGNELLEALEGSGSTFFPRSGRSASSANTIIHVSNNPISNQISDSCIGVIVVGISTVVSSFKPSTI